MSRWIRPTEAHLRGYLSDTEIASFRETMADSDKVDTLAMVIDAACHQVRGKIAGNRINRLAAGATVPKSLLRHTMVLAMWDIMSRPGASVVDASGSRKRMAEEASKELDKIAEGAKDAIRVEAPDADELDADENSRWNLPGALEIVASKTATLTEETLVGL